MRQPQLIAKTHKVPGKALTGHREFIGVEFAVMQTAALDQKPQVPEKDPAVQLLL